MEKNKFLTGVLIAMFVIYIATICLTIAYFANNLGVNMLVKMMGCLVGVIYAGVKLREMWRDRNF